MLSRAVLESCLGDSCPARWKAALANLLPKSSENIEIPVNPSPPLGREAKPTPVLAMSWGHTLTRHCAWDSHRKHPLLRTSAKHHHHSAPESAAKSH